jgi:hypothetical protein
MTLAVLAMRYMIQLAAIIQETNAGADSDMADGRARFIGAEQTHGEKPVALS